MRVAVTGAGGFIGRAAVRALSSAGIPVAPHVGPPGAEQALMHSTGNGTAFDICDVSALEKLLDGCDCVVHLAGPASVRESMGNACEYVRSHVLGTASVLEAMRRPRVQSIIYVSSAEVYGSPETGSVDETHPIYPRSPYAAAKAGAEMLVRTAAASGAIGGYVLRPFSVYGAGMAASSLIASIVSQAHRGDEIFVNDLSPVRDYCYLDDLTRLIVRAVSIPRRDIVTLNAAYGAGYSVADVIRAAGRALRRPLKGFERGDKRPEGMEIHRLVANVRAAERELGWTPHYDLEDGLRMMLANVAS